MKEIDFNNLPVGTSIRFLKEYRAIADGAYCYKRTENNDWYCSSLGESFSDTLGIRGGEVKKIVADNYGEIKVPSDEAYTITVGDVFMIVSSKEGGNFITIKTIGTKRIRVYDTSKNNSYDVYDKNMYAYIRNDLIVLVDGPQMVSLTGCPTGPEPKDNGTRETCFWCHRGTVPLNFGFGSINASELVGSK